MATITLLSPTQGHSGQTLTITGTGLGATTKVNFGAKSVTPATVSATTVTVAIPVLCCGQVAVSVTSSTNTTSNSMPFFYICTPDCGGLSAVCGPAAGGTSVTVYGSSFLTATGVTVGGTAATGTFPPPSDTQITVTTPAHTMPVGACTDTVDVIVTTAGGSTIPVGNLCQYTYYTTPAITTVTPGTGPVGTTITITGTCLLDASDVSFHFGATAVPASFVNVSDTQITATVPATLISGNSYDVSVTTCGGTANAALAFTVA
jgi:hypothetical protein